MPTNDFLQYATAIDANVETQADYIADSDRTEGVQAGTIARSAFANKAWRQANAIVSALAQLCVNILGLDMLDNADQSDKITKLTNMIKTIAAPTFISLDLGTPTGSTSPIVAHGLGGMPNGWVFYLVNLSAQYGYNPGDTVNVGFGGSSRNDGVTPGVNATNVYAAIGSNGIYIMDTTDHTGKVITPGDWDLKCNAWKFK